MSKSFFNLEFKAHNIKAVLVFCCIVAWLSAGFSLSKKENKLIMFLGISKEQFLRYSSAMALRKSYRLSLVKTPRDKGPS